MTPPLEYVKADISMVESGLSPRLVVLYGRLVLHQGKHKSCCVSHAKLGAEIGGVSQRQVIRLLNRLRELGAIEWTERVGASSVYRVLPMTKMSYPPDKNVVGGMTKMSHIKEDLKRSDKKKPSIQPKGGGPEAGRLAELEAVLTQAWPRLVGRPGKKLLERVAEILGDAPLDEFRVLLESKGRRVQSFGLSEALARELCDRRKNDAAVRENDAALREGADAADRKRDILELEALLADPVTRPEDREQLRGYIADLKRSPKSEPTKSKTAKRGAA